MVRFARQTRQSRIECGVVEFRLHLAPIVEALRVTCNRTAQVRDRYLRIINRFSTPTNPLSDSPHIHKFTISIPIFTIYMEW